MGWLKPNGSVRSHTHASASGWQAIAEVGVDIAAEKPKILTDQAVREPDVVITMGCGDTCPFYPGKRYEEWTLDDPAGQGVESVRLIRDEIRRRVDHLLSQLIPVERDQGRRLGISNVVAEDHLTPAERTDRGSYVGRIAGALSRAEYLDGLTAAGFVDPTVRLTRQAADGMHSAIVQATKPEVALPTGD